MNSRKNLIFWTLLLVPLVGFGQVRMPQLDVDNIRVDGNTISTTNTNGDLTITNNGTGKLILSSGTATTVPYLDSNKKFTSSSVTPTELGYLSGVSSALQTQMNLKAPLAGPTFSGTITTPLTASRACVIGASSELAASATTATELGYVNGVTSAIQTQLNTKAPSSSPTLVTPTLDVATLDGQGSTPSNPSAGFYKLFVSDTTSKLSILNSSGALTTVGSGGSTGINYLQSNPDAEIGATTGWATYNDAAATSPVNGVGGSPSVTWTTSSTLPLRGTNSFLLTKGATNRQGDGVSFDFDIDLQDVSKVLQVSFDYTIASGTYADNDVSIWLYDTDNSVLIQPAPYLLKNHTLASISSGDKFFAEFQVPASTNSLRLIIHVASTSASAYTLKLDNFIVGPQTKAYGSPVTDWAAYTPTITFSSGTFTNITPTGYWRRVGDSMELMGQITHAGTPGTFSNIFASLPSGYSIDTTKINISGNMRIGDGSVLDSGTTSFDMIVETAGTTNSMAFYPFSASGTWTSSSSFSQTQPMSWAAGDAITWRAKVPILGWGSSQIASNEAGDNRLVSLIVNGDPASATSGNPIIFPSVVYDSHGAYNVSTGRYTCPVSGVYDVHGALTSASSATTLIVYKDAASTILAGNLDSNGEATYSTSIQCNAGNVIDLRPGGTVDASLSSLSIEKRQAPAQVLSSESVSAKYRSTAANNLVTDTIIDFATKDWDSHGAVTAGASWKFTAPQSGEYLTCTNYFLSAATASAIGNFVGATLRKNGAASGDFIAGDYVRTTSSVTKKFNGCSSIKLLAGEYIDLRGYNDTGQTHAAQTTAGMNYIEIRRVGNY